MKPAMRMSTSDDIEYGEAKLIELLKAQAEFARVFHWRLHEVVVKMTEHYSPTILRSTEDVGRGRRRIPVFGQKDGTEICLVAACEALRMLFKEDAAWAISTGIPDDWNPSKFAKSGSEHTIQACVPAKSAIPPELKHGERVEHLFKDTTRYIVQPIPSAGSGSSHNTEYLLVVRKSCDSGSPLWLLQQSAGSILEQSPLKSSNLELLLRHAAKLLAHVVPVLSSWFIHHRVNRLYWKSNAYLRSADDILAYDILDFFKSLVPQYAYLGIWRVSRTESSLERIAGFLPEKPDSHKRPVPVNELTALGMFTFVEQPYDECNNFQLMCLEFGEGPPTPSTCSYVQLLNDADSFQASSVELYHDPGNAVRVTLIVPRLHRKLQIQTNQTLGQEPLNCNVPSDISAPSSNNVLKAFAAIASSALTGLPNSTEITYAFMFVKREQIVSNPDLITGTLTATAATGRDNTIAGERHWLPMVCLTIVAFPKGSLSLDRLQTMQKAISYCLPSFDSFSHVRLQFRIWTNGVALLQKATTRKSVYAACEYLCLNLFRCKAFGVWIESSESRPQLHLQIHRVDEWVNAKEEYLANADEWPSALDYCFFRGVDKLPKSFGLLKEELRSAESDAERKKSSGWEDDKISGIVFHLPYKSEIFVFIRSRNVPFRSLERSFCNSLGQSIADALDRVTPNRGKKQLLSSDFPGYESLTEVTILRDAANILRDIFDEAQLHVFHLDYAAGPKGVLILTDAHIPLTRRARELNRCIALSTTTLAGLAVLQKQALFGQIVGDSIVAYDLGSRRKRRQSIATVPYAKLLDVDQCVALPIVLGSEVTAVVVVGWKGVATGAMVSAGWRQLKKLQSMLSHTWGKLETETERGWDRLVTPSLREIELNWPAIVSGIAEPSTQESDPLTRNTLPNDLDLLFPETLRQSLNSFLEKCCHKFTLAFAAVRLHDWFKTRLYLLGSSLFGELEPYYDTSSLQRLAPLCYRLNRTVSLPRSSAVSQIFDGLTFKPATKDGMSAICLPLRAPDGSAIGTLYLESQDIDAFWLKGKACEHLRDALSALINGRIKGYQNAMHQSLEALSVLATDIAHTGKNEIASAIRDNASLKPKEKAKIVSVVSNRFLASVEILEGVRSVLEFSPLDNIFRELGSLARQRVGFPEVLLLTGGGDSQFSVKGNSWLFRRAFRQVSLEAADLLRQHFSAAKQMQDSTQPKLFYVFVTEHIVNENRGTLYVGHNGPAFPSGIVADVFWRRLRANENGWGKGLALSGWMLRATRMYPLAHASIPETLMQFASLSTKCWPNGLEIINIGVNQQGPIVPESIYQAPIALQDKADAFCKAMVRGAVKSWISIHMHSGKGRI